MEVMLQAVFCSGGAIKDAIGRLEIPHRFHSARCGNAVPKGSKVASPDCWWDKAAEDTDVPNKTLSYMVRWANEFPAFGVVPYPVIQRIRSYRL
jgi:hypothetical protein